MIIRIEPIAWKMINQSRIAQRCIESIRLSLNHLPHITPKLKQYRTKTISHEGTIASRAHERLKNPHRTIQNALYISYATTLEQFCT